MNAVVNEFLYFDELSFLGEKYITCLLTTSVVLFYELSCEHAEACSVRDTPPFPASGLKLVHTSTLYCHIQMILLHFQLKGNVHGVNAYLVVCVLHACSSDSRSDSHLGKNVWNPLCTFILSHQYRLQR